MKKLVLIKMDILWIKMPQNCRKLILLSLLLALCLPVFAQQMISVKGTVKDKLGNPLIGVTIKVQGKTQGTVTDANGKFVLKVEPTDSLMVSYIGYKEQVLAVLNRTNIEITLEANTGSLNEVVVVAYGEQKKASVTGAISSISGEELKQSPAANLAVSLAGRLPGLTVAERSAQPGRVLTEMYLRGQGTTNSQSPLILVDGVERDLSYIDPNEVESITILKDASATALYGVRGANGVVLVTTKRGENQKPVISFTSEEGLQSFSSLIKPVNAYQYATLANLAYTNDGLQPPYSQTALNHYKNHDDPLRYPDNDWDKLLIKPYSLQQRYNLNVTGGGNSVKYFVNAGYLNEGGQFNVEDDAIRKKEGLKYDPAFRLKRYNFRSNIDMQFNKSLHAFLNVAGYLEKVNQPWGATGSDPALYIVAFSFDAPANMPGPLTKDGQILVGNPGQWSPYALINRSGYVQQTNDNVTSTFGMEQKLDFITEGLSVKADMSFDASTMNTLSASRGYESWYQIVDPNLKGQNGEDSVYYRPSNAGVNSPLTISGSSGFISQANFEGFLNYNRTFNGKHNLSGMILYQRQQRIINQDLPYNLIGLSGRLSYGYADKYFLEFDAGYNGSEQFAPANRFGFFPAISGAWVVSKEKFMENNKIISLLKLRGSYGEVGNDQMGSNRFLYLDNIQLTGGGFSGSLAGGQAIITSLLGNKKIQWEVSKEYNLGIDVGLFDNSLELNVNLWKARRNNILTTKGTIPLLNGLPLSVLPPVNIGIVDNKGYEIELTYKKAFNKDFSVLSKFNLNFARNKQMYVDEPELPDDYAYRYQRTGFRIGQPFGYIVTGYFKDSADIAKSPIQNVGGHASRPGDFKYKDINGDGIIDQKDEVPIGYSTVPEVTYGGALSVNYKRFDVSVLLQGVAHVSNYWAFRGTFAKVNYVSRHLESWTAERAAKGEPILYPRITTQASPDEIPNSFFIENTSYLRLKDVELGYTFPSRWASKIGSQDIRIYVNGFNLITWDRLPTKDFDPEQTSNLSYPLTRIYNFGINIKF